MEEEELHNRLLYRDGLMLVIDKPAGIAVHRGPKGGENLEDFFHALRFGLPRNTAFVHRLDRDTSGCLVLGRHHKALEKLGLLFKQGKVAKTYWAIVEGRSVQDEGLIDLPLKRLDPGRGWWMKSDPLGLPSQTSWRVLGRSGTHTFLELASLTGRTHQLRVHCAAQGWPILGDAMGMAGRWACSCMPERSRFHKNKDAVKLEAPPPLYMRETLAAFVKGHT
jgi:tRNA pseudouridine32 synthase / 23S rRNA pseudouridine746 synthase